MVTNYCNMSKAIEERFGEPLLQPCGDGTFITAHQACFQARAHYMRIHPDMTDSGCECPCHEGLSALQEMERFSQRAWFSRTLTTV